MNFPGQVIGKKKSDLIYTTRVVLFSGRENNNYCPLTKISTYFSNKYLFIELNMMYCERNICLVKRKKTTLKIRTRTGPNTNIRFI